MISLSLRALSAAALLQLVPPLGARAQQPLPPVKHVFIIMLENEGFDTTFAKHPRAPYLADTLRKDGAFLRQYYGTGHLSLDNYISLISGMPPTPKTQADCALFEDFIETGVTADGQPIGNGCVYPAHVATIANQLDAAGLSWRGFMEDMGKDPARESATCGHPPVGTVDPTISASPADQYAAKHDPFVYFHAVIDSATCERNVVPLTKLEETLKSADKTPNYSFITPNLCHDGHDRRCKNGETGSLEGADAFLQHWIPIIRKSAAYKADGMIIITFDEALSIDATSCCDEQSGPNTLRAGVNGPGGGRIGAVVLSRFIKPGTVSDAPYNHYSLLRTVEDLFGLSHLGYAGQAGLAAFGPDVFTRPKGH
ncbi:MAG TPA: alkaline phosphatase family protein [Gemmatimonadaceae bacterium]|jgi:hypothetical protein